jgi:hypothetical protein
LLVPVGVIRVGLAHDDEYLAALVHGPGDKPLAAVQHPLVALLPDTQLDIGGIRRGHLGFGHGIRGADIPVEQGRQPLLLLGRGTVFHEHFHVAGIRGVAVEHLRRPKYPPHDLRQGRIIEIAEAVVVAELGMGRRNKQVPQARGLRLGLEVVHDRQVIEAAVRGGQLLGVSVLIGKNVFFHECLELGLVGHGLVTECKHEVLPGGYAAKGSE